MEFQLGDRVLYGIHGVCRIAGTEIRKVDRKNVEYFVLEPVNQSGSLYYVPTQNQAAVAKLRRVLTPEELTELLRSPQVQTDCWIADENRRKQCYRDIIGAGDRAALLQMVCTLHRHRKEQLSAGRKFHLCDESFLQDAQKLLSAEFALVLNIPTDEVGKYIQNELEI